MKNPQPNISYMKHVVSKCWFKPKGPLYDIALQADAKAKRSELITKLNAAKREEKGKIGFETNKMAIDPASTKLARQLVSGDETKTLRHSAQPITFSEASNAYWGSPESRSGSISPAFDPESRSGSISPAFDPESDSDDMPAVNLPIKVTYAKPRKRRGVLFQPRIPSPKSEIPIVPEEGQIDSRNSVLESLIISDKSSDSSSVSNGDNQVNPEKALIAKSGKPWDKPMFLEEHERMTLGVSFTHVLLTFEESQPKAFENPILDLTWPNFYWFSAAGINPHGLWEPCKDTIEDIKDDCDEGDDYIEHFTGTNDEYHRQLLVLKQNKLFLKMGIYFLNILNCEAEKLQRQYPSQDQQGNSKMI